MRPKRNWVSPSYNKEVLTAKGYLNGNIERKEAETPMTYIKNNLGLNLKTMSIWLFQTNHVFCLYLSLQFLPLPYKHSQ